MSKANLIVRMVLISAVLLLGCFGGKVEPLFNGKNLEGWYADGGRIEAWSVEEGILKCIAPGGGWLTTDQA